jgi:hypothetical protein
MLALPMPAAVSASVSPAALLASIVAAARTERSVHYVNVGSLGPVHVGIVGDAGVAQGIQRITYRKGTKSGHVTVIGSSNSVYFRGDAFTLVNYMGFKAIPAAKYAGAWVLIPHTDMDYSTVAAGVTLSSAIAQLKVSKPLSSVPGTTIKGYRVLGVRGKVPFTTGVTATATLYARASGKRLPVKEVVSQPNARLTVTLDRWGETVHVTPPQKAVPISTTGLE